MIVGFSVSVSLLVDLYHPGHLKYVHRVTFEQSCVQTFKQNINNYAVLQPDLLSRSPRKFLKIIMIIRLNTKILRLNTYNRQNSAIYFYALGKEIT